jgi:hydroxymethylpyrimidine/phosphomethylpyrimidine kinase
VYRSSSSTRCLNCSTAGRLRRTRLFRISTWPNKLVNDIKPDGEPVKALTIAGSDSGGAAGLQADLKTFTALKVYGMSVITAVTAQNSLHVTAVHYLPPDFLAAQLDAVLSDYGAAAAKTGFIGRPDLIQTIADKAAAHSLPYLVIDPVLVNHKGQSMFPPAVTHAYRHHLLPLAWLITPNRHEAALLAEMSAIDTPADMETAARTLQHLGPRHILIKGGRDGNDIVDLLFDGEQFTWLRSPYLHTPNTHGSGDTLSAAITAYLAQGNDTITAVHRAHHFTAAAIRAAVSWRLGKGHGPLSHFRF